MFEVNDHVVFGSTGVCLVTGIIQEDFRGRASRQYYVLNPIHGNRSTVYIPTDNRKANLRKVLTKAEVLDLLRTLPANDSEWINDEKNRKTDFNEALQSGDQRSVARMIRTLCNRRTELEGIGKKLSMADAEVLKAAEGLLWNELALVLGIDPDQVALFIQGEVRTAQRV